MSWRQSDVARHGLAFWRWWTGELLALVPPRWQRHRRIERADIVLGPQRIEIVRLGALEGVRYVEEVPIERLGDEAWADLGAIVAGTRTRMLLSAPDTFATVVLLPLAARSRLRAAVALQLDAIAPVRPEHISWSCRLLERRGNRLAVLVAMARATRLDALASLFREHDLPCPPICIDAHGTSVELVPGHDGSRTGDRRADRNAALFALALIAVSPVATLAGAGLLTLLAQHRADMLEPLVRPVLAEERSARRSAEIGAALRPLLRHTSASELIEGVAASLPPGTYVTALALRDDRRVTLTADAPSSALVAAALQHVPEMIEPAVQDEAPSGAERVRVQLDARAR